MKIKLIQPNYAPKLNIIQKINMKLTYNPYITLQQIATITPKNHTIQIIDEAFQQIDFNEEVDIVGITCCTPSAPRAYQIADEYQKRGVTVVLGGYHPSALPKEAKQHAESVVIGEGEISWPLLLKDFIKNQIKPFYHSKISVNLDSLPQLKRNIGDYVFSMARIEATRGCPYKCDFCSISNSKIGWHHFRKKSIDKVIEEIQTIPQKTITFCDTSLTIDTDYTKSLFTEMKQLNKKFICYGNAHVLNQDEELLQLAKDAGCLFWNIGFESISQDALNCTGKKSNKVKDYLSLVKKIHGYDMAIIGQFIFGFDTDTTEIFNTTTEMIDDLEIDAPSINILTPFPGTPLYDRLEEEGRILTKDWEKYTLLDVVFQPKKMSPLELLDGFKKVVKKYYSFSNLIKRDIKCIQLGFSPFIGVVMENLYERGIYNRVK